MEKFEPKHTPFPWFRYDDGGTLPGVYESRGGWRYGPESADWVWGPKGPGAGIVADCSPHNPCTTQSRANAILINAIPDLVDVCEEVLSSDSPSEFIRDLAKAALRKAGRIA